MSDVFDLMPISLMMMFENRNDPPTIWFSVTRLTRMYRLP